MKEGISLLGTLLGLTTAVIVLLATLNKTDTVEVPVIRDVAVLQPSNPPPPAAPTATESTETPTDTVTVPDVVTSAFEEAEATLTALSLVVESGEAAATELCAGLASGQVASTEPSAGTPLEEGDTVILHVCE